VSGVDKNNADQVVFCGTDVNFQAWSCGITDLVTAFAESNSNKIKPTQQDCEKLQSLIRQFSPKTAILFHSKVINSFLTFLGHPIPPTNDSK
jgi:hypothetical protein